MLTPHKTELWRRVDAIEQLIRENDNSLPETNEHELRVLSYTVESGSL